MEDCHWNNWAKENLSITFSSQLRVEVTIPDYVINNRDQKSILRNKRHNQKRLDIS